MVRIKYYRSNNVLNVMSFKILNDMTVSVVLDPINKIWVINNERILSWKESYSRVHNYSWKYV